MSKYKITFDLLDKVLRSDRVLYSKADAPHLEPFETLSDLTPYMDLLRTFEYYNEDGFDAVVGISIFCWILHKSRIRIHDEAYKIKANLDAVESLARFQDAVMTDRVTNNLVERFELVETLMKFNQNGLGFDKQMMMFKLENNY